MAQIFSNTLKNPAQKALSNKMDTSPLAGFKAPSSTPYTPNTKIGGVTTTPMIKQSSLDAAYSRPAATQPAPAKPQATQPTTSPTPASTPTTLTFNGKGLPATLPVANTQTPSAPINPAPTAPTAPQAPGITQSGLIQRAIDLQKQSADFSQKLGQAQTDVRNNPNYSLDTGIGRAGALQQSYGLQGQNLASQANTAASLAGMVAPVSQFGLLTNPLSGQAISPNAGGNLNPLNNISSIASQVISGQISPSEARTMGGTVGNWGAVLNSEIMKQNPNANLAQLEGAYSAKQANAQLGGTATQQAYGSIYDKALNDYANLQQSVGNVDEFGALLTSNMAAGGINPSDIRFANQTIAQIRGQLSSGAQAQFDTTMEALKSKISGMLAIGGSETPTALTAGAQRIIDGSLPLSALQDVLSRIETEGQIMLKLQADKVNNAKANLSAGAVPTSASTGEGLYNF
jgi:hypothetical protein